MRRDDRLDQLLKLLRSHRFTTADRLARKLGVSKRTIYRDIRRLIRDGIGIRGEAGVGYALARATTLPPIGFTADEALALLAGARLLGSTDDPELDGLRGAIDKLEGAWSGPPPDDLGRLARLQHAVGAHLRVALDGPDGEARTVCPLALTFAGAWVLEAWSEATGTTVAVPVDELDGIELLEPFDPSAISPAGRASAAASPPLPSS